MENERPETDAETGSQPPPEAVARALAACVRASLEDGEDVEVPGLGTFRVEHQPSQMNEQGDGTISVTPPRDTVAFDPSASS